MHNRLPASSPIAAAGVVAAAAAVQEADSAGKQKRLVAFVTPASTDPGSITAHCRWGIERIAAASAHAFISQRGCWIQASVMPSSCCCSHVF